MADDISTLETQENAETQDVAGSMKQGERRRLQPFMETIEQPDVGARMQSGAEQARQGLQQFNVEAQSQYSMALQEARERLHASQLAAEGETAQSIADKKLLANELKLPFQVVSAAEAEARRELLVRNMTQNQYMAMWASASKENAVVARDWSSNVANFFSEQDSLGDDLKQVTLGDVGRGIQGFGLDVMEGIAGVSGGFYNIGRSLAEMGLGTDSAAAKWFSERVAESEKFRNLRAKYGFDVENDGFGERLAHEFVKSIPQQAFQIALMALGGGFGAGAKLAQGMQYGKGLLGGLLGREASWSMGGGLAGRVMTPAGAATVGEAMNGLAAGTAGAAIAGLAQNTGIRAGSLAMGSMIAGSSYGELREKGVTPGVAAASALANATMQLPMESIGLDRLVDIFKAKGVREALGKALVGMFGEGATEWAQKWPEYLTHTWAESQTHGKTAWERANWFMQSLFDPERIRQANQEAMLEGAVGAMWGGLGGGIRLSQVAYQRQRAAETAETLRAIHATVQKAKDAGIPQDAVASMLEAANPLSASTALVDAKEALELFQAGVPVLDVLGGITEEELAQAADAGGFIGVKFSEMVAAADDATFEQLAPHVRLQPLSQSEAEALASPDVETGARVAVDEQRRTAEKVPGVKEELKRIEGEMKAAGVKDAQIPYAIATLSANVLSSYERFGQDPVARLKRLHYQAGDAAAPADGTTLNQFYGEQGVARLDKKEKTARLADLDVARQMETAGKDAAAVKLATGWERGADGKWRYEMPDPQFVPGVSEMLANKRARSLWTILKDGKKNSLLKAYPGLAGIKVQVFADPTYSKARGHYIHGKNIIQVNERQVSLTDKGEIIRRFGIDNKDTFESTLYHELQHIIQFEEGFARGGSWREFDNYEEEIRSMKQIRDAYYRDAGYEKFFEQSMEDLKNKKKTIEQHFADIDEFKKTSPFAEQISNAEQQIKDFIADYREKYGTAKTPEEIYLRLMGEVESRNVSRRMDMTPEERRSSLASATEDVAREDQIKLGVVNGDAQPALYQSQVDDETARLDAEYMDAVNSGDMAKASAMVESRAREMGFDNAIPEQTGAYHIRTKPAPKKTIKVFKVFTLAPDGSPTALFVNGTEKLPQNVWLDAQDAYHFQAKNGAMYVPSTQNPYTEGGKTGGEQEIPNEEVRQELVARGFLKKGSKAKKITALAYRPGWHAGTLPFFPQGGKKVPNPDYTGDETQDVARWADTPYPNVHRYNQVVFECEMAFDEDYNAEAQATKDGDLEHLPVDGSYYYATNPLTRANPDLGAWVISGSLKINRALTKEECDALLADKGMPAQQWEGGTYRKSTPEERDAVLDALFAEEYAKVDKNGKPKKPQFKNREAYQAWYDKQLKAYERKLAKWESGELKDKPAKPKPISALTSGWGYESGELNLESLGYVGPKQEAARKTLAPVTYDEEGNVIPLSKRFDRSNPSVLYQSQIDLINELFQRAWHGTPHRFDKFTLDHIGTGEGAQVHGYGLYFAQRREVSEGYRRKLLEQAMSYEVNGKKIEDFELRDYFDNRDIRQIVEYAEEAMFDEDALAGDDNVDVIKEIQNDVDYADSYVKEKTKEFEERGVKKEDYQPFLDQQIQHRDKLQGLIDRIKNAGLSISINRGGQLFEVEIPNNDVLLDEQKRFSEQPEKVQQAIEKLLLDHPEINYKDSDGDDRLFFIKEMDEYNGRGIYDLIANRLSYTVKGDYKKAASLLLKEYGILGITYEGGIDGRCFVIWDEEAIEILDTLYQAKKAAEMNPRGSYSHSQAQDVIRIFQGADASTVPHEAAHSFLQNLMDVAQDNGAMARTVCEDALAKAGIDPDMARRFSGMTVEELSDAIVELQNQIVTGEEKAKAKDADKEGLKAEKKSLKAQIDALTQYQRHLVGVAQAQEDLLTLREWCNVPLVGELSQEEYVQFHEQVARGFEGYLATGKAPTMKLAGVFARMKAWLLQIYKAIRDYVGADITPEVRAVYDRMLATEEEMQRDQMVNAMLGIEPDAISKLGCSASDSARLGSLLIRAHMAVNARVDKERAKERRKRWKAAYDQAYADLAQAPLWKLVNGEFGRINYESIVQLLGREHANELRKKMPKVIKSNDGSGIDVVAMGFDDPQMALQYGETADGLANYLYEEIVSQERTLKKEASRQADEMLALDDRAYDVEDGALDGDEFGDYLDAMDEVLDRKLLLDMNLEGAEPRISKEKMQKDAVELGVADVAPLAGDDFGERLNAVEREMNRAGRADNAIGKTKVESAEKVEQAKAGARKRDKQAIAAAMEARAAERKARWAEYQARAKEELDATPVRDIDPKKYAAQLRQALKGRTSAILSRDTATAVQAVQQARYAFALMREAKRRRDAINKAVNRLVNLSRRDAGAIPPVPASALARILKTYGFRTPSKWGEDPDWEERSLQNMVDYCLEESQASATTDIVPDLAEWVLEEGMPLYVKGGGWQALTWSDWRDLMDVIDFFRHAAKEQSDTAKDNMRARVNESVQNCVQSMSELMVDMANAREGSFKRSWQSLMRKTFGAVQALQWQARKADGFKNVGPKGESGWFESKVLRPILEGENKERQMKKEMAEKLSKSFAKLLALSERLENKESAVNLMNLKDADGNPVVLPEALRREKGRATFTGDQVAAIACNCGNEGNRQRITGGYEDLSFRTLEALFGTDMAALIWKDGGKEVTPEMTAVYHGGILTADDWAAVQEVWDALGTLWPGTVDVHRDLFGFAPAKTEVKPVSFRVQGQPVALKGGYYPIKYDKDVCRQIARWNAKDELFATTEAIYAAPAAKTGHTKSRQKKTNKPLLFSTSVITEHVNDAIKLVCFGREVRFADRVTQNDAFAGAYTLKFGKEDYNAIRPNLKGIVRSEPAPDDKLIQFANACRKYLVSAGLWGNLKVALLQTTALGPAMGDLGAGPVLGAMGRMAAGMATGGMSVVRDIWAASPYMHSRWKSFDQDLIEEAQRLDSTKRPRLVHVGDKVYSWEDVVNFGMLPLCAVDMVTSCTIWSAAYAKYMKDKGVPGSLNQESQYHEEAVRFADDAVKKSNPDFDASSRSAFLRAQNSYRLVNAFGSAVTLFAQRSEYMRAALKQGRVTKAEFLRWQAYEMVVPAIAMTLIIGLVRGVVGGDDDDSKELGKLFAESFMDQLSMKLPVAGPLIEDGFKMAMGLSSGGRQPTMRTALDTPVQLFVKLPNAFTKAADGDDEAVKKLAYAVGDLASFIARVPVAKLVRNAERGYDQWERGEGTPLSMVMPAPGK